MWFCCLVSLALMPWKSLASAHGFLAFLGVYDIFMGLVAALMIMGYWVVRRGNIVLGQAYTSGPYPCTCISTASTSMLLSHMSAAWISPSLVSLGLLA
ncbi:hypothetical protein C8Q79DRAFT_1026476 [Trametes meyenii]|nr:hypothetical protein C8Q79DRAFT_1026476 [Trametes meyenii]